MYIMEHITTEEVMKTFQAIFGKLDELGWWDMKIIQNDSGTQLNPRIFKKVFMYMEYYLH